MNGTWEKEALFSNCGRLRKLSGERHLISLSGPLFSPGLEHRPPHDGVGCFGLPMLQAESAEIGALQQCPRDGRRIVPTEIPSATGGSRFSSSSADLLRRPPEACAVAPQAMQDDCQLAGERDLRFGGAGPLGQTHAPRL